MLAFFSVTKAFLLSSLCQFWTTSRVFWYRRAFFVFEHSQSLLWHGPLLAPCVSLTRCPGRVPLLPVVIGRHGISSVLASWALTAGLVLGRGRQQCCGGLCREVGRACAVLNEGGLAVVTVYGDWGVHWRIPCEQHYLQYPPLALLTVLPALRR